MRTGMGGLNGAVWLASALIFGGSVATIAAVASGGSFTAQQIAEGKSVYEDNCAVCHQSTLKGSSHGPALVGAGFAAHWRGRSSDELFQFVKTMMPPGRAGELSDQEYLAASAYILAANGHGAGSAPLTTKTALPVIQDGRSGDATPVNIDALGNAPEPNAAASVVGASSAGETPQNKRFATLMAKLATHNRTIERFDPVTEAMLTNPAPGDWINWRRTRDGHGDSPLAEINVTNAGSLQLAWTFALPDGINEPTPLVHDGIMFVLAPGGRLVALDAASGDFIWDYRYAQPVGGKVPVAPVRNIALYGNSLFIATPDAALVAIDARTGKQLWRTQQADPKDGFTHTAGPIIAKGVVVAGMNGCERFKMTSCFVAGYDPETGHELWRTPVIAQPGTPGDSSWANLRPGFRAGGDMWIAGSYDAALDTFYIGTAQAKPWVAASRHMSARDAALYTNSTLALDPTTGRMKWYFQHLPGDSLDLDVVFERVLVDLDGRPLLFTIGKDGLLWKLDRRTGKYLDLTETVYQDVYSSIDRKTGRLTLRPDIIAAKIGDYVRSCPTTFGGHDWQAMAYDGRQGTLVIPLLQMCGGLKGEAVEFNVGGGGLGGDSADDPRRNIEMPGSGQQFAKLAAYDARAMKQLWSYQQHAPFTTSALTTAGGLTFVGDSDRYFKAFDTRTGKLVWQTRLGTAAQGFPISYSAGGKQYIAVPAGQLGAYSLVAGQAGGIYQPSNGNAMYVFALPNPPTK